MERNSLELIQESDVDSVKDYTTDNRSFMTKLKDWMRNNRSSMIGVAVLAVLTTIAAVVGVVVATQTMEQQIETYDRLPLDISPETYVVEINSFFTNYTFHTRVNITFQISLPVQYIILNAFMLENLTASITGPLSQSDIPITWPRHDVIRLTPLTDLTAGQYVLTMECDGFITDDLLGLYRSTYAVADTIYPYLFTTKLESSSARRVFPCWDEPQFKARFTIILIGPESQQYYSNMPIRAVEQVPNSSTVKVTFEQTELMSTYLLAFVIGELSEISATDEFGTIHRVVVPKGTIGTGQYGLDVSVKSLKIFSIYFQRFYPLPKLDNLAVRDFQSGAMEHWGMVTYREARLLPDESSPFESRMDVVETVCHENAHMWFGDLVTMKWWNDLWLNEGFASWIMNICADELHPEFQMWSRFLFTQIRVAMLLDAKKTTHPIILTVENTDTIRAIYNDISYRKGASVVRMLDNYVTPDVFKSALRNYIELYAYQNTITSQLWDQVSEVSGIDINNLMSSWTNRPGFPYVQASLREGEGNDMILSLSQKRFFADGVSTDEHGTVWIIPVLINCASSPVQAKWSLLFNTTEHEFILPNAKTESWIKLNHDKSSFIMTMYSPEMLSALQSPVSQKQLNSLDRFDIGSDLYLLAAAGHAKLSEFLDFVVQYLAQEDDFTVWSDVALNIQNIGMLIEYMSDSITINDYGSSVFGNVYQMIGTEPVPGESPLMPAFRALALKEAGMYGYADAQTRAFSLFEEALGDFGLEADIRKPIFIINANKQGFPAFERLKQFYLTTQTTDLQRIALEAMGFTMDTVAMTDIFNMIFTTNEIRMQDIFYPLESIGQTKMGREFAWEYTKSNIDKILNSLTIDYFLDNYIEPLFSAYADVTMVNEMTEFFNTHSISLEHMVIRQLFEQIEINAASVARSTDDVLQYLESFKMNKEKDSKSHK